MSPIAEKNTHENGHVRSRPARTPAAAAFALLRLSGAGTVGEFVANKETGVLADPTLREVLLSSFTTLAGATMVLAYRRSVIAGPSSRSR